jgi:hypothetical protein
MSDSGMDNFCNHQMLLENGRLSQWLSISEELSGIG